MGATVPIPEIKPIVQGQYGGRCIPGMACLEWARSRQDREAKREYYRQMMMAEFAEYGRGSFIYLTTLCEMTGLTLREARFLCDNGMPHTDPLRWVQPLTSLAWLEEFMPEYLPLEARRQPISAKLRARVLARDGGCCVECGATDDLTMDHIKPWSLGGRDTFENLQTLCQPCNSRKGASW